MNSKRGIVYAPEHGSLRLDVHYPPAGRQALSTYLYFHSGGLTMGARDEPAIIALAEALTARGVVMISAGYRLYPQAAFPDYVRDAARAAAWVMANRKAYALPGKVFLGGSSAGGYLSMMLCFARQYLSEVGLSPEDFSGFLLDAGQPTTHFEVMARRGDDPRRVMVDDAAPLYYVRDAGPRRPMLLICAERDIPGRVAQNRLLLHTLEAFGADPSQMWLLFMPGCEHVCYLNPENQLAFAAYTVVCASFLTGECEADAYETTWDSALAPLRTTMTT